MSQVVTTGPIAYRLEHLAEVCQESVGHEHNYDHTTFVHRGRLRVTRSTGEVTEHEAGEFVVIPATVRHALKALEPNTVYYCLFSHRDFDGLVTQRYVGNARAYG